MASATTVKTFVADTPILNKGVSPFQCGNHISAFSVGTPVIYGVNSPAQSDTTKFFQTKQVISGNKAFPLGSDINTPLTTISSATQLRGVVIVGGSTIPKRASGAAVAAAGTFIFAAGGGTAAGETGLVVEGAHAAGVTAVLIKDDGVNTETVLVGDKVNFSGANSVYDYYATATLTTLNGTTSVSLAITPPLQVALAGGETVTITAADGKTMILGDAPAVGATVEVWVLSSTDVITVTTLVASTPADIMAYDVMSASAAASIYPLAKA